MQDGLFSGDLVPKEYELEQAYPFNPTTTNKYQLPTDSKLGLKVNNLLGQEVATLVNGIRPAGRYNDRFNAANLASGIYFYRIEATSIADPSKTFTQVKMMVILAEHHPYNGYLSSLRV